MVGDLESSSLAILSKTASHPGERFSLGIRVLQSLGPDYEAFPKPVL